MFNAGVNGRLRDLDRVNGVCVKQYHAAHVWICASGEQISPQNIIDCHTSCVVNLAHTGCTGHLSRRGDNVPDKCAGSQRLEPCLTASYWA